MLLRLRQQSNFDQIQGSKKHSGTWMYPTNYTQLKKKSFELNIGRKKIGVDKMALPPPPPPPNVDLIAQCFQYTRGFCFSLPEACYIQWGAVSALLVMTEI